MFRKQSSVQGRWLSPDPAGLGSVNTANPQSWNRYAYVMNNPMTLIDPLGLDCVYTYDDGSTYVAAGDCGMSDNGYYVDGLVGCTGWNCSQITYNPDTDFLAVQYTLEGANVNDPASQVTWSNVSLTAYVSAATQMNITG